MEEGRVCKNCNKSFSIDASDFNYYEKIKVPAPTWCPECRMIRRMACANSWSLFWRNCDKCDKRTLSVYPSTQKITVYCQSCWWADDWDGSEYAMDYDPSKPFLVQWKKLQDMTPFVALETNYLTLKNCDYTNSIAYSKNCVLASWADFCENVYASAILNTVTDTADSLRIFKSELCYESIGQNDSYRVFYSQECDACTEVWFSRNCYSSMNCIGCVNLKRKNYSILNKQYSKEEYETLREKIIADMKKNPYIDEQGRVWTYGEFFQPGFSKFAYNNSNAFKFFPKTKEEALKCGYVWNDEIEQQAEATILGKDLPETITEVDDSILEKVIACTTCERKYKIASLEFDLLRKMNMPLPTRCLKCREKSRFAKLQMPRFYDRTCDKCGNPIRTSYASDRPEIVYCVKCYQQEFS